MSGISCGLSPRESALVNLKDMCNDKVFNCCARPSSSPVKTASVSASAPIPDPALVIAMFFHYADSRSVGGKYQHSFRFDK